MEFTGKKKKSVLPTSFTVVQDVQIRTAGSLEVQEEIEEPRELNDTVF